MGGPGLLLLIGLKSWPNYKNFGCSRSPDVDEIKMFDKDDQATKH